MLEINTLSVSNKSIQFDGYQNTFVKLMELGIRECGWLPFQKNSTIEQQDLAIKTIKNTFEANKPSSAKLLQTKRHFSVWQLF
jgi:hypothetical protein